jgi:deoxyguanosine kinase
MNLIVIEGNIGAGKTSLAKKIGSRSKARVILEQFTDNPFLPRFYEDPERYSLPLELSFLSGRYNQIRNELIDPGLSGSLTVADYCFSKSLVFARITLSGHEYKLFRQFFDIMNRDMPRPDLYVYLHKGTDKLLDNIKIRGRPYEQSIKPEYLERIEQSYFKYMEQQEEFRVLFINAGNLDFVDREEDFDSIAEAVLHGNYPLGINHVVL